MLLWDIWCRIQCLLCITSILKWMGKNKVIVVQNINITVSEENFDDYICITDIVKAKVGESRGADVVKNWMRNRATLESFGTWEQIYNPVFKVVEFDHFKSEAGLHTFVLSVSEWIEKTECANDS